MKSRLLIPAVFVSLALAACAPGAPVQLSSPEPLPSPAAPGAGEPRLALSPSGDVLMTWFEPGDGVKHALRFARLTGDTWSEPVTIAAGDSFFVNWADFPALVAIDDRRLAVSYPWVSGEDTYAYDVKIRQSADGGATWGAPMRPHDDGTATEHGFVTLLAENGALRAVWLDGRNFAGHDGHGDAHGAGPEMTVRTALIAPDGSLSDAAVIDARVCDCCTTAGVVTPAGTMIAYRDRSPEEVRDVSLARFAGGAWSAPAPLREDGWEIPGCPVNGPAMAASGSDVAAAWYTQARDTAMVWIRFSTDGGAAFGAPVRVDGGDPLGRTGVALLEDGSAVVSWMEMVSDTAEVRLRRVAPDGKTFEPMTLARNSPRRSSGFPQVVRDGSRLVCAWTEPGEQSAIRLAAVKLGR
jgi:hypothetical protein